MRTRHRRPSRIPEVNLVPMMDVLMTVLIFFVVISMGLTGVQINGVTLPRSVNSTDESITSSADEPVPFVIGLTAQRQLVLEGEIIQMRNLSPRLRTYFQENPDGSILLKADRTLPYDDIANLLDELRGIGGRRVSLAVE
ncbi:biopolymer transporter ExbD [cf. Phormidesmis sp. LEGE 11477]|uniref:ExbD/TolR family protein n=1 Tax=cf. Phormidesmis sp. LEGE 11477 TaxID=1828680 RepID=UPI0018812F7C|nr:biopolymer transporter ExbD [cf. Phormidesmis sp. LEGE 11477]MBE9059641.1 biopolymer transporter ExbD [cf. Phormidesmis sp. LEGE 11477]